MSKVTYYRGCVTIVAVETQQFILCVFFGCTSLSKYLKIQSVAQQYFYGKFMLPATMERMYVGLYVKCPILHCNTGM
jgi:hypothetical protein